MGSSAPASDSKLDPVLRNAIRYTVSVEEYDALHRFLRQRTPKALHGRTPKPSQYSDAVSGRDDYNAAAIRASLRLFCVAQTGLKLWDVISTKVLRASTSTK